MFQNCAPKFQVNDGSVSESSQSSENFYMDYSGLQIEKISAGKYHTCKITGQSLQCWGWNGLDQIGDGNFAIVRRSPIIVISNGVTDVSSGGAHTCAVVSGSLRCWGQNSYGQLGDGTTLNREMPVVIIPRGVTQVSSGNTHTCAVVDSSLQC